MEKKLGKLERAFFWHHSRTMIFLKRYRSILPRIERQKIRSLFRIIKSFREEMRIADLKRDTLLYEFLQDLGISREEFELLQVCIAAQNALIAGDELRFWKIITNKSSFTRSQEMAIQSLNERFEALADEREALGASLDDYGYKLSMAIYDLILNYRIASAQVSNLKAKNGKTFSVLVDSPFAKATTSDGSEHAYLCGEWCSLWVLGLPLLIDKGHFHCILCGTPINHNDPCWVTC